MQGKGSLKFYVGFPHIHATILTMSNTDTTTSDYVKALTTRAEQMGGLHYAMGFLNSTLAALKLQGYELEILAKDAAALNTLIKLDNQHRDNRG